MSHVCTDQQHQLFLRKKALLDLDLPPRKLSKYFYFPSPEDDQQPLQHHEDFRHDDDDEEEEEEDSSSIAMDPYSSNEFRMYKFKVEYCPRTRSHVWTDCPFAHPGEKARRRDPLRYRYSSVICPDFRRSGVCPRKDDCDLAHGVFECWLHPTRYRTMPCKDGKGCMRKVCFFAHTPLELRILGNRSWHAVSQTSSSSPTSTLLGLSNLSPQVSPTIFLNGIYTDLLSSLKAMEISKAQAAFTFTSPPPPGYNYGSSFLPKELSSEQNSSYGSSCGPDLEWVNELVM